MEAWYDRQHRPGVERTRPRRPYPADDGIPYFVHNRGYGGLYPGIRVDLLNRLTILVPMASAGWAKDVLSEYLSDPSGLRANRERSLWHVVRLIVEALFMGWCVPRVSDIERKT